MLRKLEVLVAGAAALTCAMGAPAFASAVHGGPRPAHSRALVPTALRRL